MSPTGPRNGAGVPRERPGRSGIPENRTAPCEAVGEDLLMSTWTADNMAEEPTIETLQAELIALKEEHEKMIAEMEAQNFCEFICSGYEDIVKHCAKYANAIGVDIGAMGKFTASQYKGWGYTWHNRDKGNDISQSKLKSYIDAGMEVSVFTLDNDSDWALISGHWKQLRGITTNYPKRMLEKTK